MGFCHPKEEFRFVELCFVSNGNQFLVYFCVCVCCTFAILNLNIFDCRLELCGLEIRVGRKMVWIVNRNVGILDRSGKASRHKRKSDRNEKTSRSWKASRQNRKKAYRQKLGSFSSEARKFFGRNWKTSRHNLESFSGHFGKWLVACCQKFEKNVMWNAFNFHFQLLESFLLKTGKFLARR